MLERKRVTHYLGEKTTRGKRPPADIVDAAKRHMATVNACCIPAEQITTLADFVETHYLPWVEANNKPSTCAGYKDVWDLHLKPLVERNGGEPEGYSHGPRSDLARPNRKGAIKVQTRRRKEGAEPKFTETNQERNIGRVQRGEAAGIL